MFSLEFASEFFYGEGYSLDEPPPSSDRPTSVLQALYSTNEADLRLMVHSAMEHDERLDADQALWCSFDELVREAMHYIREYDTCDQLHSPIRVYLGGWLGAGWVVVYSAAEDE